MNVLKNSALILASASGGNPIISTVIVILFFVMFNFLMGAIEKVWFGKAFMHLIDPIVIIAFISYSAYAVWYCAVFNSMNKQ